MRKLTAHCWRRISRNPCSLNWPWIVLCHNLSEAWGVTMGGRRSRLLMMLMVGTMVAGTAAAETHKEYRFNVGPKARVSVNNPYGSISVKPSTGNMVLITALLHS